MQTFLKPIIPQILSLPELIISLHQVVRISIIDIFLEVTKFIKIRQTSVYCYNYFFYIVLV